MLNQTYGTGGDRKGTAIAVQSGDTEALTPSLVDGLGPDYR